MGVELPNELPRGRGGEVRRMEAGAGLGLGLARSSKDFVDTGVVGDSSISATF